MRNKTFRFLFFLAVLIPVLLPGHAYSQQWSVILNIVEDYGDSLNSGTLEFGVNPDGTDSVDSALGETELPPKPPFDIFDVRFTGDTIGNGLKKDIRDNSVNQKDYIIDIQRAKGGEITISWESVPQGTFILQDLFGGLFINVDMSKQRSYIIPDPKINQVIINATSVTISPKIMTTSLPDAQQDQDYSEEIEASDEGTGNLLTFSLEECPDWLSIDSETGVLSGTSGENDIGSDIPVRIKVTYSGIPILSDILSTTITVIPYPNYPPEILTSSLPDATEDQAYNVTLEVTDQNEQDTLKFELVTGPDWLTIDSDTGSLTGTPRNIDVGIDISVSIRVVDSGGLAAILDEVITILPRQTYAQWSVNLNFVEQSGDLSYYGSLEFGVNLEGTDGIDSSLGEIELPPKPPIEVFAVRFTGDSIGNGLKKDIRDNSTGQKIYTVDIQRAKEGDITISWDSLPQGTFVLQDLFDGAALNVDMTKQNSCIITNLGIAQIKIYAESVAISPTILTTSIPDATQYHDYSVTIAMRDGYTGKTLTFSIEEGPEWLSIDSETGVLSGTPDTDDIGENIPLTVKVIDTETPSLYDVFSTTFSVKPVIQLISPKGGEQWAVGSSCDITWNSIDIAEIVIEYSVDGGASWETITESADATTGIFVWNIPYGESSECLVRISDKSASTHKDVNDNTFAIFAKPFINVISPSGDKEWTVGTIQTITWTSQWINKVVIEYSVDGGESWNTIVESTDASSGSYTWTIPDNVSSSCFIRITDTDDANIIGTNQDLFSIVPEPYITLISPNSGDEWLVGSMRTIAWESYGINDIRIEFSTDGGTNWSAIADSIDSSEGVFIWTVPDVESSECLMKINDTSDETRQDILDSTFTVLKTQFIQVTSPNGGEKWEIQSTHEINWAMYGIDEVIIEYSSDGGSTWDIAVENVDADERTFTWILPEIESNDCLVRITDTTNAGLTDTSDTSFTILPPQYLEITSPNGGEEWEAGSIQNITWSYIRVSTVKIEYSGDNGVQWMEIVESADASPGSFSWTIPDIESIKCLVRITDTSEPEVSDSSNETFAIYRRSFVDITSPSADERWPSGSQKQITWKYYGITDVRIKYSTDSGLIWHEIVPSESALTGSYSWLVPDVSSTECVIRISDATDSTIYDVNDGFFEIFLPEIRISHDPITESKENEPIPFAVQVTSEGDIENVILYYDMTGRRVFARSEYLETSNEGDHSATLGAGVFTTLGIEYYFTARAKDGSETKMPSGSGYYSICAVVPEATSAEEIMGGTEVTGYRMISVPLELTFTSITDQLNGRLPGGKIGKDWRLFRFSSGSSTPLEYPDIEGLGPGKAFWLITKNDYRLRVPEGKTITTSKSFSIILKPGWNDIANPWMFDISWDDIENPSGANLSVLYIYEGAWSDPTTPPANLKPWKGYAVNNLSNMNALIKLKPEPAGKAEKAVATDTQIVWMLTLKASAGEAKDDTNHLGVRNGALEEWDSNDHVEPPPIGKYVSLSFPHHDWEQYPYDYTVDFRPPGNTISWDFDVKTNISEETVIVKIEGIENLPEWYYVKIFDRDSKRVVENNDNTFSFISNKGLTERHFMLVVSDSELPELEEKESRPEKFVIAHCYPNPLNPQTTIRYELSMSGKVTISIYNALGQQVKAYDIGNKDQGVHETGFDASELTSGIYFYRVDAGYASVTGKMLYMK